MDPPSVWQQVELTVGIARLTILSDGEVDGTDDRHNQLVTS